MIIALFLLSADDDYSIPTPASITISPAQAALTHCFNIATNTDQSLENRETFSVSLASADRAVEFAAPNASVAIIDQPTSKSYAARNTYTSK